MIEKLEVVTVPGIDSASRSDRLEKAVVSREDISSTSLGADRVVWGLKRPLATWAAERSVPIHGPPPGIPFADWTFPPSLWKDFDIAVAVSFGHLIPKHMIEGFKKGGLNVHASLLPK